MKKLFTSVLLLLAFTPGPAQAQQESWLIEGLFTQKNDAYGHLEYFGFYASAMESWNFTRELAPFTNLTWIKSGSASDPEKPLSEMILRLKEAREEGVKATLDIESFLFANEKGAPRAIGEIEAFLIELRARLEVEGLLDTLAMIYPKDEPFRNFVEARNPGFIKKHVTGEIYLDVHADLFLVNELVKIVFPEVPIGVILSGHDLHHRFFSIPENYDWVGFDCYDELFSGCGKHSFVEHYERLLEYMQPHQRLIAVPETWAAESVKNSPDWPDILLSRLKHHYEIVLNEPRFIAFIPFIWSFDANEETPGLGLNRFPELYDIGADQRGTNFLNAVKDIGRQIKIGVHEFPNMSWEETENSSHRQASNFRGGILGITPDGIVSAWAVDDALPHKNLRVKLVIRNTRGKVIFSSTRERTFIRSPAIPRSGESGHWDMGLHGYLYQVPEKVFAGFPKQVLEMELVVYADGEDVETGIIFSGRKSQAVKKSTPGRVSARQLTNK